VKTFNKVPKLIICLKFLKSYYGDVLVYIIQKQSFLSHTKMSQLSDLKEKLDENFNKKNLMGIARKHRLKGWSKFNKTDLIHFLVQKLEPSPLHAELSHEAPKPKQISSPKSKTTIRYQHLPVIMPKMEEEEEEEEEEETDVEEETEETEEEEEIEEFEEEESEEIVWAEEETEETEEGEEEIEEEEELLKFEDIFADLTKRAGKKKKVDDDKLGYYLEIPYIWRPGSYSTAERHYLIPEGFAVFNSSNEQREYDPKSTEQAFVYPPSEMGKASQFFMVALGPTLKCLNEYENDIRYLGFPIKFLRYEQCIRPFQIFKSFPLEEEPKIVPDFPIRYKSLPKEILQEPISRDYENLSFSDIKQGLIDLIFFSSLGIEEEEGEYEPTTAAEKRLIREDAEHTVDEMLSDNVPEYQNYKRAYTNYLLDKLGWFSEEAQEDDHYEEDIEIQRERNISLELIPEYVDDLLVEEELGTGVKLKGAKKKRKKEELTQQVKGEAELYLSSREKEAIAAMRAFLLEQIYIILDDLLLIIYLPEEITPEYEAQIEEELRGFLVEDETDEEEEETDEEETDEEEEYDIEESEEISLGSDEEEEEEDEEEKEKEEEEKEKEEKEEKEGNMEIRSNDSGLRKLFQEKGSIDQISFCVGDNRCILEYDTKDATISLRPYSSDEILIATDIEDILDQGDEINRIQIEYEDQTGNPMELDTSNFKIQKKRFGVFLM